MERRRPRSTPSRPLVLIIDDAADTRELCVALPALGFDVVSADCAGSYQRAWIVHPDILLTDLTDCSDNPWRLMQLLKADPRTRQIPVVALSGHSASAWRERAMREGCSGFLVKP